MRGALSMAAGGSLQDLLNTYGGQGYGYYAGKRGGVPQWGNQTYDVAEMLRKDPSQLAETLSMFGIDIGKNVSDGGDDGKTYFQKTGAPALGAVDPNNPYQALPRNNSFSQSEINDIIKRLGTDKLTKSVLQKEREFQSIWSDANGKVLRNDYHKAKKGVMDWFAPIFKIGVLGSIAAGAGAGLASLGSGAAAGAAGTGSATGTGLSTAASTGGTGAGLSASVGPGLQLASTGLGASGAGLVPAASTWSGLGGALATATGSALTPAVLNGNVLNPSALQQALGWGKKIKSGYDMVKAGIGLTGAGGQPQQGGAAPAPTVQLGEYSAPKGSRYVAAPGFSGDRSGASGAVDFDDAGQAALFGYGKQHEYWQPMAKGGAVSKKQDCLVTEALMLTGGNVEKELRLLRAFRDEYMKDDPDLAELVEEYEEVSPLAVQGIDKQEDAERIYEMLGNEYIKPAVKAILEEEFDEALRLYAGMMTHIQPYVDDALMGEENGVV